MTAGLQVTNASGVFQIDGENINYQLVASGTLALDQKPSQELAYNKTVSYTANKLPLLALRPVGFAAGVYRTSRSGSIWTWTVETDQANRSVDYWIFDQVDTPTGTFGLQVFDGSGDTVFDAAAQPLRVVGLGDGTYTSGRTYAFITTQPGYIQTSTEEAEGDFENEREFWGGEFTSGTPHQFQEASISHFIDFSAGSSIDEFNISPGDALIIDVTDY